MNIDKMEAGREMDALIWLMLNDKPLDLFKCRYVDGADNFSTDISVSWLVDKPDWYWVFTEMPNRLQITLYPSREVWDKRPFEMQFYPKESIHINVTWKDCKTKAEAYALGRCRAALKAVGDVV
jgi:hypothetical protein